MSVIVENMDMPENCYHCALCVDEGLHIWCPAMNASVAGYCSPNSKVRHPKCPLKEIK